MQWIEVCIASVALRVPTLIALAHAGVRLRGSDVVQGAPPCGDGDGNGDGDGVAVAGGGGGDQDRPSSSKRHRRSYSWCSADGVPMAEQLAGKTRVRLIWISVVLFIAPLFIGYQFP